MPVRPAESGVGPSVEEKATAVKNMFGAIAPRYDLLNHLLSLNIDRRWRRRAVDLLLGDAARVRDGAEIDSGGGEGPGRGGPPGSRLSGKYLDACSGTLDLALELGRRPGFSGRVYASDFTFAMLERGQPKIEHHPVVSICADALSLPFPDAAFDGATVGFGVRNLADLDRGLHELARVIRPGGRLVILEFTTPRWQPVRGLYLFYFRRILPLIGRLISRHSQAYQYLPDSVLEFPEPPELAARMRSAGFSEVDWQGLTGGVAALHLGIRSADAGGADRDGADGEGADGEGADGEGAEASL